MKLIFTKLFNFFCCSLQSLNFFSQNMAIPMWCFPFGVFFNIHAPNTQACLENVCDLLQDSSTLPCLWNIFWGYQKISFKHSSVHNFLMALPTSVGILHEYYCVCSLLVPAILAFQLPVSGTGPAVQSLIQYFQSFSLISFKSLLRCHPLWTLSTPLPRTERSAFCLMSSYNWSLLFVILYLQTHLLSKTDL